MATSVSTRTRTFFLGGADENFKSNPAYVSVFDAKTMTVEKVVSPNGTWVVILIVVDKCTTWCRVMSSHVTVFLKES